MSKKDLSYRYTGFRTINLEIKDVDFYYKKNINIDDLDFDFNFSIEFINNKMLEIFIHYCYSIEGKWGGKKGHLPIYHSDHILNVHFEKEQKDKSYEVTFIANLLGTVIVMSKGYYDNITKGYKLNEYRLPVFKPIELVNAKYENIISDDIISFITSKKKKSKSIKGKS